MANNEIIEKKFLTNIYDGMDLYDINSFRQRVDFAKEKLSSDSLLDSERQYFIELIDYCEKRIKELENNEDVFSKEIVLFNSSEKEVIVDGAEKFNDLLQRIDVRHLDYCSCQNDKIEEVEGLFKKRVWTLFNDAKFIAGVQPDWQSVEFELKQAELRAKRFVANYCMENKIVCPVERSLVNEVLVRFSQELGGRYDLNDPRVFLIFKSLLNSLLSSHRLQLASTKLGLLVPVIDRNGNRMFVVNNIESVKREFDKMIIDSIEKLSRIIEGDKSISLNLSADVKDYKEVLNILNKNIPDNVIEVDSID